MTGTVMIGRAPNSDIQVVDDSVSRQHARLKVEPDGTALLTDLMSSTGTLVGGRRIEKHTLRPGETITIGDSRFVYEQRHGQLMTSPSFVDKSNDVATLHRTHSGVEGAGPAAAQNPAPTAPQPPNPEASPAPEPTPVAHPPAQTAGAPTQAVRPSTEFSAPRGPLLATDPALPSGSPGVPGLENTDAVAELVAMFGSEGGAAPQTLRRDPSGRFSLPPESTAVPLIEEGGVPATNGDFALTLKRLLRYHELSQKLTQGQPLITDEQVTFDSLEDQFRKDSSLSASRRQWKRFPIIAPGTAVWFRNLSSKSVPIEVDDIGAAGLRFKCRDLLFVPGDVISVVVKVPGFNGKQAVFSGRVAWVSSSGNICGTMFLGPGTWQPE